MKMTNTLACITVTVLAFFSVNVHAEGAPIAVSCEQETYALCAYAKCTMNDDMMTANCPCYSLSGSSLARIDVIPDPKVKQATLDECVDATACSQNNAPICEAIADGTLWPGADAVSTFSRALEIENGVMVDGNGERGSPNWNCAVPPSGDRLVPNCMLAPCRALDGPVSVPYFEGDATMECTCPLIKASTDYSIFGGLVDPCDDGTLVNVGGPTLAMHAMDTTAVALAWEAVTEEFSKNEEKEGSNDDGDAPVNDQSNSGQSTMAKMLPIAAFVFISPFLSY